MLLKDHLTGEFRLTPLTPFHIGSGDRYCDIDYEIRRDEFIVKDINKWLDDYTGDPEEAVKILEAGAALGKKFERYRIAYNGPAPNGGGPQSKAATGAPTTFKDKDATPFYNPFADAFGKKEEPAAAKAAKVTPKPAPAPQPAGETVGEVRAFIKDSFGRPYLPGSSIKGAIRTALAYQLCEHYAPGPPVLERLRKARGLQSKATLGAGAVETLFGKNPSIDVLKALVIRDSPPLDMGGRFAMVHIQVQSVRNDKLQVKSAAPIYAECLMPSQPPIAIPFYVDQFVLREDKELGQVFGHRTADLLGDPTALVGALKAFSQKLCAIEKDFYLTHGRQDAANFFNGYIGKNDIILPISFGAGWYAKTLGARLEPEELQEIRDYYEQQHKPIGRPGVKLFPKSRKFACTSAGGKSYRPMGWCKLEVVWK